MASTGIKSKLLSQSNENKLEKNKTFFFTFISLKVFYFQYCLGVRLTAQINTEKPSEVIIREEKCPNGTFQSNESHCFDVCSEKHRDIGLLGETYRLHSYGDNVNPTIVYCNYEKGFYSTKNKTWIDFDRESKFNPFLCRHVDDFNPCSGKMAPLPSKYFFLHISFINECFFFR